MTQITSELDALFGFNDQAHLANLNKESLIAALVAMRSRCREILERELSRQHEKHQSELLRLKEQIRKLAIERDFVADNMEIILAGLPREGTARPFAIGQGKFDLS